MGKIDVKDYVRRYVWLVIGLFIVSFGIAMSTKANLGVSPVSSLPYVLSLGLKPSLGMITIVVQVLCIVTTLILLRRDFKVIYFAQIILGIIFGYFTDFSVWILSALNPPTYITQWVFCIISMFIIAFGVNMQVRADVLLLPSDGLIRAIAKVWKKDFGQAKIFYDCLQVVLAVVFSFILMRTLSGVREGTIAAAVFIGMIVRMYNKKLGGFYQKINLVPMEKKADAAADAAAAPAVSPDVHIITIAREVGAGGREIGHLLGEKLGVPVYDKDLIGLTAEKSGLTLDEVEQKEQQMILHYFRQLYNETYYMIDEDETVETSIKNAQQEVITEVAAKESCVIIGRLGNYFLRDNPNCYHVFIHGELDYRIEHFAKEHDMNYEQAKAEVERREAERERHYRYYTGGEYGHYRDYHLSINSAVVGSEKAVEIIREAAEDFFANEEGRIASAAAHGAVLTGETAGE